MRKLIVSNLVSADGFFEGVNRDLSGFKFDTGIYGSMATLFDRTDTILIGKDTYEFFVAYWPGKTKADDPAADFMNQFTKVVFSKTLTKAPWGKWKEAILIKENIEEAVKQLKVQPGKDMIIFGSGDIVNTLSKADLIDEYRFIVNPVILGQGKPQFDQNIKLQLKLKAATVLPSGLVVLDYERNRS
jgi:dihydrofolate reductase